MARTYRSDVRPVCNTKQRDKFQEAFGRDVEGARHRQDQIRLAQLPSVHELRNGREVLRLALRSTPGGPRRDRPNLDFGKGTVIRKVRAICLARFLAS